MTDAVRDRVSTIIPVYNRADLLTDAVRSVLAQTWPDVEIIIVDDGSTDDTQARAHELAKAHPHCIQVIVQSNAGPAASRQAGLDVARGEFIQYLDSDDLLMPEKFALQVAGLRANPQCGISYGKTRRYSIGATPQDRAIKRTGEVHATLFPTLLQSRWWSTSTPLYRRSVCDEAGPWNEALHNEEDWEYECRVAALGTRLHHVPEFVSDTRDHDQGQLHGSATTTKDRLRHRAAAHALILGHARRAGIGSDVPQMHHFARELFLLCRQCGAAGLVPEARHLFQLALDASHDERARGLDFRLYALAARVIGWRGAGLLSAALDRVRPRHAETQHQFAHGRGAND